MDKVLSKINAAEIDAIKFVLGGLIMSGLTEPQIQELSQSVSKMFRFDNHVASSDDGADVWFDKRDIMMETINHFIPGCIDTDEYSV
jgi:hypothetical protein